MSSALAVVDATPDLDAFGAGFETGLYVVVMAIGGLLVIATVRKILGL